MEKYFLFSSYIMERYFLFSSYIMERYFPFSSYIMERYFPFSSYIMERYFPAISWQVMRWCLLYNRPTLRWALIVPSCWNESLQGDILLHLHPCTTSICLKWSKEGYIYRKWHVLSKPPPMFFFLFLYKVCTLIYHNLQFYPVYKFLNTIKYPIALKHSVESWRSV